jgi:uncharacterized protein (DUF1330 family)
MVHIIVHLFAAPGQKEGMKSYEDKVLRIFRKHGGEIVAAFKPSARLQLGGQPDPDEIQILTINSMEAFEGFKSDSERLDLSNERKRVITRTELFISKDEIIYE